MGTGKAPQMTNIAPPGSGEASSVSPRSFWLSLHARYQCRHSGVCCSSDWPIPLESVRMPTIVSAIERGDLPAPAEWIASEPGQPAEIAGVLARAAGRCVFHRTAGPRAGCAIQHAAGHDALPSACQHFPRVCLIDARGVFVTLSHYCPTAADLLFSHEGPIAIVEGPPAVRDGNVEGLDARDSLPPLLTPTRLMDLEAYSAWERHMIAVLADGRSSADGALSVLAHQAAALSAWRPGKGALVGQIASLTEDRATTQVSLDWQEEKRRFDLARTSVPPAIDWSDLGIKCPEALWEESAASGWLDSTTVIKRYLATHAFASWMAYQGSGLMSILRRLQVALAVLRFEVLRLTATERKPFVPDLLKEAIRQTDLLLVHLVDRDELARRCRDRDSP